MSCVMTFVSSNANAQDAKQDVLVEIQTNYGNITLKLFPDKAPKSVENFLGYVDEGFYSQTIFHRVIPTFMIQGGGMTEDMREKKTRAAIENEADNGLSNKLGTVAMARTGNPHSATSQFFINTKDNPFLDHRSKANGRTWGYCVFGQVIKGMSVVNDIKNVQTATKGFHENVPVKSVIITKAIRVKE
ncbi:MAG TPA: peptidylprolyl isomerase [Phycisphaerales bacterium]|nr:peptidylprolyl isomerase [Phycisphaerales bacterium]HCD33830.1 peptidylprolyl isomerase [Phycisphaerales bacterium]